MNRIPLTALGLAGILAFCGCVEMRVVPMLPELLSTTLRVNNVNLELAYDSIDEKRFDLADRALTKLERGERSPEIRAETAFLRALLAERQGMIPEAIAKYEGVIATYPNTPDAYLSRKKLLRLAPPP